MPYSLGDTVHRLGRTRCLHLQFTSVPEDGGKEFLRISSTDHSMKLHGILIAIFPSMRTFYLIFLRFNRLSYRHLLAKFSANFCG
jgi:hypothetical protein